MQYFAFCHWYFNWQRNPFHKSIGLSWQASLFMFVRHHFKSKNVFFISNSCFFLDISKQKDTGSNEITPQARTIFFIVSKS